MKTIEYDIKTKDKEKFLKQLFKLNKGIYLYGKSGIGKTHLIGEYIKYYKDNIHRALIDKYGSDKGKSIIVNVKMVNSCDLFELVMRGWRVNEYNQTTDLDDIKQYILYVIDDIGVEQLNTHLYSYLYKLTDIRYELTKQNYKTIFISNYSLDELSKRLNKTFDNNQVERIMSRIKGCIDYEVAMKGVDLRWQ